MLPRWPTWLSLFAPSRLALPSQCLACHAWPCPDVLCTACQQRFAQPRTRCRGCALSLPGLSASQPHCGACLQKPALWQQAHAWMDYSYPWNTLIARWKFEQQPALAPHFARWMQQDPHIRELLASADVLIPIPLSAQRMRERGYNPAAQLAQLLSPQHHQLQCLQRPRHTPAQSHLTRAQRLRNLRHAFAVAPTQGQHIANQSVLLIDDVMTTGATFTAASRTLLQAGARKIDVLCMARTP